MVVRHERVRVGRGRPHAPRTTPGVLAKLLASVIAVALVVGSKQRSRLRRAVAHEARRDALTGLGNRLLLRETLDGWLGHGRPAGLLIVDLDRFRTINDTAGHHVGDALLVTVARRLRATVRPSDTVLRIGGDEFAVLCPEADTPASLEVAAAVLQALSQPLTAGSQAFQLQASIGVSSTAEAPADRADLERQADIALHAAKSHGGARAESFTTRLHADIVADMAFRKDLVDAVMADAIEVVYQPIVDLTDGRLCRLEALARWEHPQRGAVPPDEFIPVAEDTGVIGALGTQVLNRACAQLRSWQAAHPTACNVGVAVNVSPVQLGDQGFVDTVRTTLDATGLDAGDLTIEVTEGALASTVDAACTVRRLRELGVRVAVDDFGTGHSSLGRLGDLHVNELKIDRAFVRGLDEADSAGPLVVSILALARSLDLDVVAEGVETAAHLAFLTAQGCPCGQGYLFSRPLAVTDCPRVLADPAQLLTGRSPTPAGPGAQQEHLAAALSDLQDVGTLDEEALRALLAELHDLTGLEATYLTRIDWEAQVQHIRLAHNAEEMLIPEGLVVPWKDAVCRRMLANGPMATSDASTMFADVRAVRSLGLHTYVGVPVTSPPGVVYGSLCGASRRELPVSAATVELFQMFADLIASHLPALDPAPT